MELNISKCKSMHVSCTSLTCPHYNFHNTFLELVSSNKYLGVHISRNLFWNHHMKYSIAKAKCVVHGSLQRNFYVAPPLPKNFSTPLTFAFNEYASSHLGSQRHYIINEIQAVQNCASHFILSNHNRTASVTTMKSQLNLSELTIWHLTT